MTDPVGQAPPLTAAEAWFQRRISTKGDFTEQGDYSAGKSSMKKGGSEKFMMEELQKIKKSGSIQFKLEADTTQTATSQDDLDDSTSSKRNLKTNSSHKLMKFFAAAEDEIKAVVATVSTVKTPSHRGGSGLLNEVGSDPQTDTDTDTALSDQPQEPRQGPGDNPGKSQKKVEQFFGGLDQGHVKERKYTKSYNKVAKLFDLEDGGEGGQVGAVSRAG